MRGTTFFSDSPTTTKNRLDDPPLPLIVTHAFSRPSYPWYRRYGPIDAHTRYPQTTAEVRHGIYPVISRVAGPGKAAPRQAGTTDTTERSAPD